MTISVNNGPLVTNYTPTTTVQNNTEGGASGVDGGGNNVDQGSLSGPSTAFEMAYATSDLMMQILGGDSSADWGALTDSVYAANLSIDLTAVLVLLIEVMAQMRQDARTEVLEQAQAALAEGVSAAAEMMDAAQKTRDAAYVNAGLQILGGLVSMGTSGVLTGGGSDMSRAFGQGFSATMTGIGSAATAHMTYGAAEDQAQAQIDRSEAEYEQSLGQAAQAFMQLLGDAIKAFISTMQGAEQAQHQATGAIYNC